MGLASQKIITSESPTLLAYLKEVWQYRSLIFVFAQRDLKIKYAQTALGLGWAIIQPATAILVYSAFFGLVLKINAGIPYILFVISGLTGWSLFNFIFNQGSNALLSNQDLIKKMSFPKMVLPLSKVITGLVEFSVSFFLLFIAWIIWGKFPGWSVLLMPIPVIGILMFSLAITFLLISFSIKNRDLLHITPFFVYFAIWFTPVFYPVTIIPEVYKTWIYLNPMAAMIDFFRWTAGINPTYTHLYWINLIPITILFVISVFVFKNTEDKIVDYI